MEIIRYTPALETEWNEFVARSKSGTFLFHRSYMDYHSVRFQDHSLLAYHRGRLCAVLPANLQGNTLWTHQGLTYGGLLTTAEATTSLTCDLFEAIGLYLKAAGVQRVVYKTVPWIYHRLPAEEDLYALANVCHARLAVRHISSAIDLTNRLPLKESRRSGLRKAVAHGLLVKEQGASGIEHFWQVLSGNLNRKYHALPVHSAAEMRLLMERFPQSIRLFTVADGDDVVGGTVLYITPQVVHTQYISASEEGKQKGALDLLFDYLLKQDWGTCRYLDFGKSSDGDGHDLNRSLIFQKEGFGGRGICYDWYEWKLK